MSPLEAQALRPLRFHNYRLWAAGALVSNLGTWVQRTAQDWLVLVVLTHRSAVAVGVVTAMQFAPQLLLLPWTGAAADHADQRRLLMITQTAMGAAALILGVLAFTGAVRLWEVYLLAFGSGCAAAFDAPVRQVFVSQLVGDGELHGAVTLNSMSFNLANLIGPAAAGLMIAAVGTSWAFILNGLSFFAVVASLVVLRQSELHGSKQGVRSPGAFLAGLRYVRGRPDLLTILAMLFLVGTFGLNFPVFITAMAVREFHAGAQGFGLLSSILGLGALAGALVSAVAGRPSPMWLVWSSAVLGTGFMAAAIAPNYWTFAAALAVVGAASLTFINASNPILQLSTEPGMRGRVMALRVAVALGGAPLGAPLVGLVADHAGPRWAVAIGGVAGLAAAGLAMAVRTRVKGPI